MLTYDAGIDVADHVANRLLLQLCNLDLLFDRIQATKLIVDDLDRFLEEIHFPCHFVCLFVRFDDFYLLRLNLRFELRDLLVKLVDPALVL